MKKIPKHLIKNSSSWQPSLHDGYLVKSNSWFSLRKKTMFKNKEPHISVESSNIRCKKIQLKPSIKQRNRLLIWFELSRLAYNLTIKKLRVDNTIRDRRMRDIQ